MDKFSGSRPAAACTAKPSATRETTALWFPRAGQVEKRRELISPPGPGEVRVQALVSAISHGTEMLVFRGQVPADLSLDLPTLRGSFSFPIKYGYASAGRVAEVGDGVLTPRVGDLVFVHHPHQSEYVVPAAMPVPLPEGVVPEQGVFVANVETAVNIMLDAHPRLGERVVIFGQGVIGLLLAQLARRAGAGLVITVDPLLRRRDMSLASGAHVALAPDEHLPEAVRNLTNGAGADVVLEASGNGVALEQALDCVAFQGTVVACSWYGTKPVTLTLGGNFHRERIRVVSSQVSNIDPALQPRWDRARRLKLVCDLLPELRLRELITHRIPFADADEAYALVDRQPEETIQVVLTYADHEDGDV